MQPINHVSHFIMNHLKQLKRKWHTLPLLFLFPLILISLLAFLAIQFMSSDERSPIEIGLVNLDQSKESRMVVTMLETNEQFKGSMQVETMSEQKAKQKLTEDALSAYILLPKQFSNKLYQGESVSIKIIGNPNDRIRAKLIHTFVDSAARHINSAQANILAIGAYADQLGLSNSARSDLLQSEFKNYIYFTLAKDHALEEALLSNTASSSTMLYYAVSGWFALVSLWLFVCWQFFHADEPQQLIKRIRLYNVTPYKRIIAKLIAVLITVFIPAVLTFILLPVAFDAVLIPSDYFHMAVIYILTTISFLTTLGIFELLIPSKKLLLLIQSLWTTILLVLSGVAIPFYFLPERLQDISGKLFTTSAFQNLQSMIVEGESLIHPQLLIVSSCIALGLLFSISIWKERLN